MPPGTEGVPGHACSCPHGRMLPPRGKAHHYEASIEEVPMQKSPSAAVAWAIAAGYVAVFVLLFRILGVNYAEISGALVVPMAVLAALLLALTSWLGWWRPVLSEDLPAARWLLAVPALFLAGALGNLALTAWGSRPLALVAYLALGALLVGFSEEIVFRGLMVVGLRDRYGEALVCLYSSLAFGLLHGVNFFLGQGLADTLGQVVFAFFVGIVLYVARRATGTILACMALHALWDFSSFVRPGSVSESGGVALTTVVVGFLPGACLFGAVVLSLVAIRRGLFAAARPAEVRVR